MAYRSDLEAALARLDAMAPKAPCPACAARSKRLHRFGRIVLSFGISMSACVLLLLGSLTGFVALSAFLVASVFLLGRGEGGATPSLVGVGFAVLSAAAFAGFYYLERLLTFDVGRFG